MSTFDKYLQYRAMSFAFTVQGDHLLGHLSDEQQKEIYAENEIEMKFINCPFPKPFVERLEGVLSQLEMSKRDFVQRAVFDALERAETAISKEMDEVVFTDEKKGE